MRIRKNDDDDVTLEMSPLIDCVFLLLIFFLVTTMMKKLEKQIPIEVPDPAVTISENMDARRVILALGKDSCQKSGCGEVCRRLPGKHR